MVEETFPKIPGYTIKKKLGQGGMASVYLAVQESFGRDVALKIMSDQLGEDTVWAKRFLREAQVVSRLSHPNIVPVFDVGHHEGQYFISMENMQGGDLEGRIEEGLSVDDAIQVVSHVASGLDYAGQKGFVHRDIKPDNVMFREDGSAVILDFGIVKNKDEDGADKMTKTGTIVGTTAYMSPEQAQGLKLDERSDIYSLGIMFYELLTGMPPFQGDSMVAVLMKHVNEAALPLPVYLSVLQPVIDKSLAKKTRDRYARGRDMIDHLAELAPLLKQSSPITQAAASPIATATVATMPVGAQATQAMQATGFMPSAEAPMAAQANATIPMPQIETVAQPTAMNTALDNSAAIEPENKSAEVKDTAKLKAVDKKHHSSVGTVFRLLLFIILPIALVFILMKAVDFAKTQSSEQAPRSKTHAVQPRTP